MAEFRFAPSPNSGFDGTELSALQEYLLGSTFESDQDQYFRPSWPDHQAPEGCSAITDENGGYSSAPASDSSVNSYLEPGTWDSANAFSEINGLDHMGSTPDSMELCDDAGISTDEYLSLDELLQPLPTSPELSAGEVQQADHAATFSPDDLELVLDELLRPVSPTPESSGEDVQQVDPIIQTAENFMSGLDSLGLGIQSNSGGERFGDVTTELGPAVDAMESEIQFGEASTGVLGQNTRDSATDHVEPEILHSSEAGRPWPVKQPPGKSNWVHLRKNTSTWEARMWLKDFNLPRSRKGMQLFLGSFATEDDAKEAHDKAAIKLDVRVKADGTSYSLNFPEERYRDHMTKHADWSRRDYLWKMRRESPKFSKGKCHLKGVKISKDRSTGEPSGRYEAATTVTKNPSPSSEPGESSSQLKQTLEKKKQLTLRLGVFATEDEAGRAYDKALLFIKGTHSGCVTNFQPGSYLQSEVMDAGQKLAKRYSKIFDFEGDLHRVNLLAEDTEDGKVTEDTGDAKVTEDTEDS